MRVKGSGVGDLSGFRVRLGVWVMGIGFRVYCLGFRGLGTWVQDFKVWDLEFRV